MDKSRSKKKFYIKHKTYTDKYKLIKLITGMSL